MSWCVAVVCILFLVAVYLLNEWMPLLTTFWLLVAHTVLSFVWLLLSCKMSEAEQMPLEAVYSDSFTPEILKPFMPEEEFYKALSESGILVGVAQARVSQEELGDRRKRRAARADSENTHPSNGSTSTDKLTFLAETVETTPPNNKTLDIRQAILQHGRRLGTGYEEFRLIVFTEEYGNTRSLQTGVKPFFLTPTSARIKAKLESSGSTFLTPMSQGGILVHDSALRLVIVTLKAHLSTVNTRNAFESIFSVVLPTTYYARRWFGAYKELYNEASGWQRQDFQDVIANLASLWELLLNSPCWTPEGNDMERIITFDSCFFMLSTFATMLEELHIDFEYY